MESSKDNKTVIKEGYLSQNQNAITSRIFRNSSQLYFVLKSGTLECYASKKKDKLKKLYPLSLIKNIIAADKLTLKISFKTLAQTDIFLIALNEENCLEWLTLLNKGIKLWVLFDGEEDTEESTSSEMNHSNMADIRFPSEFSQAKLQEEYENAEIKLLYNEFSMIKYARNGKTIPHERLFKLGENNLSIIWKSDTPTRTYTEKSSHYYNITIVQANH